MRTVLLLVLGMMAGGMLGVFWMCLLQVGRDAMAERRQK